MAEAEVRPYPRRFSWPMRLLVFGLVFHIVFRSFSVLVPGSDWAEELQMDRFPWRLPTRAEMAELAAREAPPGQPAPLDERVMESLDDVWVYLKPWPSAKTRARITSWEQSGKFVFCWLNSRLEFVERLTGMDEEWPMFSPNVSKRRWLVRSRLVYEDGSEYIVRQTADPEDLTRYAHWNQEKVLDYELRAGDGIDDMHGYCNLLRHRHAVNDQGSPLAKIYLFWVRYYYPPPDVDPVAFLRDQTGPPPGQVEPDFFEYDVRSRAGRRLPN